MTKAMSAATPLGDVLKMLAYMRPAVSPPFHYTCAEDYVLDRGSDQTVSEALSPAELSVLLGAVDRARMRFVQKQCFYNAQILALKEPSLQYVEGFAIGRSGFPVHHAWCTIGGKLVDLTWRTTTPNHKGRLRDRVFGEIPEGWSYRGVPFDAERILDRILETHVSRAFIGDWERGNPHFREERINPNRH